MALGIFIELHNTQWYQRNECIISNKGYSNREAGLFHQRNILHYKSKKKKWDKVKIFTLIGHLESKRENGALGTCQQRGDLFKRKQVLL